MNKGITTQIQLFKAIMKESITQKTLKQIKDNMLLMSIHFMACPLFRIGGITGYTSKRSSMDDWQQNTAAISTTPLDTFTLKRFPWK